MSILLAAANGKRGFMAVDTTAIGLDGSPAETSKMIPLVHLNAVIGCCGLQPWLLQAYALSRQHNNFDDLADDLPDLLTGTVSAANKDLRAQGFGDDLLHAPHQLSLLGWSATKKCMVLRVMEYQHASAAFISATVPAILLPREPFSAPPVLASRGAIVRAARRQVDYFIEQWPSMVKETPSLPSKMPVGGRLVIAEITASDMTISVAGSLG